MKSRSRRPISPVWRAVLATWVLALAAMVLAPSAFGALTSAQRNEQIRYGWETNSLSYKAFMERKADFTANGCNSDKPKDWVCWQRKPPPYDAYLWTSDGCSVPVVKFIFKTLFAGPCEQHDFGYRNIGKGLMLDRSNSARKRIDKKLYEESKRVCRDKYSKWYRQLNFDACMDQAETMYSFFLLPAWGPPKGPENWNKPCPAGSCWVPQIGVATPTFSPPPPPNPPATVPGSGGGTTPPPPPPVAGVTETTGGVTNTWTNPANAGGTQGPTIAKGQSVVIACKLTGFRVANGNTWWYKIASAPWSGNYYASADAFYNNGATSGSLVGTPFVDPAVPTCAGSAPPPPPPAPTWGETAGGVANTWTNPANAGGTQGPSVARGQTIQIACRLQGFRVADGNTWWYRIAQSPWNNQYYVSADAFYNNGATSGSLIGTPFVDTAVAAC